MALVGLRTGVFTSSWPGLPTKTIRICESPARKREGERSADVAAIAPFYPIDQMNGGLPPFAGFRCT
ncbi:hypothetical protein ES707_12394 [subsurface metagenome]|jgi:hypothetical protein